VTGASKVVLGLMVAAAAVAAPSPAQTPPQDKVAESVRRSLAEYEKRLNGGDYAGALEYYADDPRFFWVEQGKVVARSKAEIVSGYERLKGSGFHIEYQDPLVTVLAPNLALITTGFSARMGSGAQAAEFSGLLTLVLIKTAAGWRFLSGRA
jgi:ketosteroid isomerase-like protein